MSYALLAARSAFSIGECTLPVERLVEVAKEAGATAVALTDTMSITSMIDFNNRAKKADIKPIIGCRLRFTDDITWRKVRAMGDKAPPEFYLNWYVRSAKGMQALFRLLSLANSEDHFYNTAKLAWGDLNDALADLSGDDVAIASGDARSVVSHPDASNLLSKIIALIGAPNVFATLSPVNTPYWDTLNARSIALADELDLPTLVSRPVFYPKDGADSADVLGGIISKDTLNSMWLKVPHQRDMHAMTQRELVDECKAAIVRLRDRGITENEHFKRGLLNLRQFPDTVSYQWEKSLPSLPKMAPDEFARVKELCVEGWKRRFTTKVFGHQPGPNELAELYHPRLMYELGVLKKLNFSGYFLLVHDVVSFARSNGIRTGTGRGSVGGSLVSYLMGITDCDPIRFNLLFERFINPDRLDLPDADLDFMGSRRWEIFAYLVQKYGRDKVAGVSNFMELKTASTIRAVGKVHDLDEFEYRCSKLAPDEHGMIMPLADAAEKVPEIAEFRDKYKGVWRDCLALEGVTRGFGRHAAGVVVAECDLVERAVVERRKQAKGEEGMSAVVCFDKRMVEDQGLIKMDILGLLTLDLHALALDYIRKRRTTRLDLMAIDLDDADVLKEFAAGNTTAVFQFDGGSVRRMMRNMAGDEQKITFDDLVAANALNRPGPLEAGLDGAYTRRKNNEEDVDYPHPLAEQALKDTYGVLVYQEQLMRLSKDLSGFTGSEADVLRKAVGKKDADLMAKQKDKFIDGAANGQIKVTLDDGSIKVIHRSRKIAVKELPTKFTIEEIFSNAYSIADAL